MLSNIFIAILAVSGASAASLQARQIGSVPLGGECSSDSQCPTGSSCYATNSMLIRRCGNFQASCTTDSNCAYNKCNNGFCNGALKETSTTQPAWPTVTALPHTLGLGAICSSDEQCVSGVQCWASNVLRAPRCGGFNAACSINAQCADQVTCLDGLCKGPPTTTGTWTGRNTKTSAPSSYTTSAPTTTTVAPPPVHTTTASNTSTSKPVIPSSTTTVTTSKPAGPSSTTATATTSSKTTASSSTLTSSYISAINPTSSIPVPTGKGNGTSQGGNGSNNSTVSPRPTPPPYTGAATTIMISGVSVLCAAVVFALAL